MKIQIVNDEAESIDGFIALKISDNPSSDLLKIIDNSCMELLAIDIIDSINFDKSLEFLSDLLGKIRLNGTIILKGVSSLAFSHALLNGSINCEYASDVISNIKSIHDHRDIINLLETNNFTVDTIYLGGVSYEIKATRHTNVP
jgi:hypothetical protein